MCCKGIIQIPNQTPISPVNSSLLKYIYQFNLCVQIMLFSFFTCSTVLLFCIDQPFLVCHTLLSYHIDHSTIFYSAVVVKYLCAHSLTYLICLWKKCMKEVLLLDYKCCLCRTRFVRVLTVTPSPRTPSCFAIKLYLMLVVAPAFSACLLQLLEPDLSLLSTSQTSSIKPWTSSGSEVMCNVYAGYSSAHTFCHVVSPLPDSLKYKLKLHTECWAPSVISDFVEVCPSSWLICLREYDVENCPTVKSHDIT